VQVLPRAAELTAVPGYRTDPLGEADACCAPGLLQKYAGRILMVATPHCAVHCRFCFRRAFCPRQAAGPRETAAALACIAGDPSIHEVIFSGGDPLTLPDAQLSTLLEQFARIGHVRRLRVHTRLPIVVPQRVTGELVSLLSGVRTPLIMTVHVNHPREIDDQVSEALRRVADAGIPLLSQSVLLRGVNDRAETLAALYERLVTLRVIPYYLHHLDPVAGAAEFEAPISAGLGLMAALRARLPGYAVPRYVRETPGGTSKEVLA
jgi:EF-P beta-lysylation protein EpmB